MNVTELNPTGTTQVTHKGYEFTVRAQPEKSGAVTYSCHVRGQQPWHSLCIVFEYPHDKGKAFKTVKRAIKQYVYDKEWERVHNSLTTLALVVENPSFSHISRPAYKNRDYRVYCKHKHSSTGVRLARYITPAMYETIKAHYGICAV
jgi:hypothetical protein